MGTILAFGLLTIDHTLVVDALPHPNEKILARGSELDFGGPATNAAATACVLGSPTRLITAVGSSLLTDFAFKRLHDYGVVPVDLLAPEPGEPSISTVLVTQPTGDRAVVSLNASTVRTNLPVTEDLLEDARVLLVDGHHMGTAIRLATWARARGVLVLFDGGSWKEGTDELLKWVDVAVVSADFVVPDSLDVLGYLRAAGSWAIAQSHGSDPIRGFIDGHEFEIEVPSTVDLVDTLGAGDVLHGALAHYLFLKPDPGDFLENLHQAAAVASFSCGYAGGHGWFGSPDFC